MTRHLDLDDTGDDALGIASTFPRPGWVVLDAIRERAFTGQVSCRTTPGVTIWSDRGRIYLAERDDDPSLGRRLVEAGALTDEQLAAGAVQVAGEEHLGRLFERVPDVDRSAVIVANQLMTEDTLGWLASQRVYGATVAPYRHHPAGAHRWEDDAAAPAPAPAFPAPAGTPAPFAPPPPTASPSTAMPPPPAMAASAAAPAPTPAPAPAPAPAPTPAPTLLLRPLPLPGRSATPPPDPAPIELGADDVIRWDEPGWLDRPFGDGPGLGGLIAPLPMATARVDLPRTEVSDPTPADDTVTWTEPASVADTTDPAPRAAPAAPAPTAPVTADPFERFEVIWPSGEVDEQFGGQPIDGFPNPDIDRAGPTARLVRDGGARGGSAQLLVESDGEVEVDRDLVAGVAEIESFLADQATRPEPGGDNSGVDDDVISAVRSAFANIGTGSLVHGERRIGPRSGAVLSGLTTTAAEVRRPGRTALRDTAEVPITSTGRMTHPNPASGSVFDDLPAPAPRAVEAPAVEPEDETEAPAERVTALRRLIGSLRRRNG